MRGRVTDPFCHLQESAWGFARDALPFAIDPNEEKPCARRTCQPFSRRRGGSKKKHNDMVVKAAIGKALVKKALHPVLPAILQLEALVYDSVAAESRSAEQLDDVSANETKRLRQVAPRPTTHAPAHRGRSSCDR